MQNETNTNVTLRPFNGRGKLVDMVAELKRRIDVRHDFVADTSDLSVRVDDDGNVRLVPGPSAMDFLPRAGLVMNKSAVSQLAGRLDPKMPIRFLRDAIERAPSRWADFATGVMRDNSARRFIRCLDDKVRAFLSDRYRVIESLDVVKAVLEGAQDQPVRILEASLTDTHMRIKLVNPTVWQQVEEGGPQGALAHEFIKPGATGSLSYQAAVGNALKDAPMQGGSGTVWPIVTVSNSDTGHGGYSAKVGMLQALCLNLATIEKSVAHVHLGSKLDEGIFTRETVSAEAKALALKARDVIAVSFDQEKFNALVAQTDVSRKEEVRAPASALKNVIKLGSSLSDGDLDALVAAFGQESDTVYGVGQAVARVAQDIDVDKADEAEKLAGEILTGKHNRAILTGAGK